MRSHASFAASKEPGAQLRKALQAGAAYFAVAFVAGFVLGTARALFLAPRVGETIAVAVEVPVILLVSWLACGRLLARYGVESAGARMAMGMTAFILLMAAELGLSIIGFGRSLTDHLAAYRQPAAALGLAAQIVFAALPLIRKRVG